MSVEDQEDEDAKSGGDEVEAEVPEDGSKPVGDWLDSTDEVKMLHLGHPLLDVEHNEGSRHKAECENDADGVGEADPNLASEEKQHRSNVMFVISQLKHVYFILNMFPGS